MYDWNDCEILRYLGYRGQEIPEPVGYLIEECKQELEQYAAPKNIWRSYPLHIDGAEIDAGCFQTSSKNLTGNLRGCEEILLFAATLGSRVDILLHKYGKLQVSKAVVMQAAAAAMLETYCDQINDELKEQYRQQGKYLRPRFSPGYGDFSLACQVPIAAALELTKRIGITLTDSLLMAPSKSVTAVIGISHDENRGTVRGCVSCNKQDCEYRK